MKKITFNDKFGLTQAVLDGRKTMTRRMIKYHDIYVALALTKKVYKINKASMATKEMLEDMYNDGILKPYFCEGEKVAIAQCYKDCGLSGVYEKQKETAGWANKLYVKADLMPHHIQITRVRVDKLHNTGFYDCIKEGIIEVNRLADNGYNYPGSKHDGFITPLHAFAHLIDNVSGAGTWERNPFVFVYDFKLID